MKKLVLLTLFVGIGFCSFAFKKKKKHHASATASVSKSLAFPVSGKKSNIGSFWGDSRDGGIRRHKGIDIFAKKGTPVVAISDGVVTDRGNGGRGGKVVWLKAKNQPFSAYYAHLDKQLVKTGQRVHKGQVLGTVGNTGNARTTPSHLHFGIYYPNKHAVNPLPYVKKSPKVILLKNASKQKKTRKSNHKKHR